MRKVHLRRPTAIVLVAAILSSLLVVLTAGPRPAGAREVLWPEAFEGARWLASRLHEDGYITGPGGDPSPSDTVQTALALAAARIQQPSFEAALSWVEENVEPSISPSGLDNPGAIAYVVLLAVAAGEDPTAFGGTDLLDRLGSTLGEDGMYGGGVEGYDPTYSAVYNQGLALAALAGAGESTPQPAVEWLLDQQCDSDAPAAAVGGWQSYRADPGVQCSQPDPTTFTGPDTNSTALAMQGLAAIDVEPAVDPLPFLQATQEPEGGFPFVAGSGTDPNSTAVAIQALIAFGEDPAGELWGGTAGGPSDSLISWQVPVWQGGSRCSLVEAGGFTSAWSGGFPDQIASQQAVWGVAGAPFPMAPEPFLPMELAPSEVEAAAGPLQAAVSWLPPFDSRSPVDTYEIREQFGGTLATVSGDLCSAAAIGLAAGEELSLWVVANLADGTQAFSSPAEAVTIGTAEESFTDIGPTAPFFAEINWAVVQGISRGYEDGTFRSASPVARQAMAAFLYRFAGEPPFDAPEVATFTDVPPDHPFFSEIEWLATTGITTGFDDGGFHPNDGVSRQAMAAFLYRFADEPPFLTPTQPTFSDVPPGNPFYPEVEWLATTGITTGYDDGTFRPTIPVARQAMVAFLYRTSTTVGSFCACTAPVS